MAAFNSENLFLNRAKFVMKYLGVWVPPIRDESTASKIYRIFMMTLQYLFLIFQIVYIIEVWGDLNAVSQATYLLFTQACLCFKITVFFVNSNSVRDILLQMNSLIFSPQNIVHEKILRVQSVRIKRLLLGFMVSSQVTCGLWALKPLFDDAGTRKFPFDMWMPVSPELMTPFVFGFSYQFLTISMSAYMYFGVDSVALSMLIFACAQLSIIKEKIANVTQIKNWNDINERDEVHSQNHKKLTECVKHYQSVYTFIKLVENTFHSYLLFQIAGSVGIFCMTALRILVEDWKSVQFYSSLTYLCVMLTQLSICCWCGHELTATSEDLLIAMYQCIWYEQSISFKRDFSFAMMRMSRPMVLRAGHYITLSKQTFIAILRMSYSYFAVLLNQTA